MSDPPKHISRRTNPTSQTHASDHTSPLKIAATFLAGRQLSLVPCGWFHGSGERVVVVRPASGPGPVVEVFARSRVAGEVS